MNDTTTASNGSEFGVEHGSNPCRTATGRICDLRFVIYDWEVVAGDETQQEDQPFNHKS
jgi:hypothetical protein